MSSTQIESIKIYFHQLNDKDSAVIQRVIDFGKTQNKRYTAHTELDNSHIIISSDAELNAEHQAVHIKIGDVESNRYPIFLKRPLLVTRVMRALDDAAHLVKNAEPRETISHPIATETMPTASAGSEITTVAEPVAVKAETNMVADSQPVNLVDKVETETRPSHSTATDQLDAANASPNMTKTEEEVHYDYRALVVDDSAAIRKQLELELKASHIYPDFAETGEEALEKIQQNQYDLIFLDIILPGIDGYEVCKAMRLKPALKKTPIIMLSGKTSPLDEVKGVLAGASTYLTKPVRHEQFQQTLKRVAKWLSVFATSPAS